MIQTILVATWGANATIAIPSVMLCFAAKESSSAKSVGVEDNLQQAARISFLNTFDLCVDDKVV